MLLKKQKGEYIIHSPLNRDRNQLEYDMHDCAEKAITFLFIIGREYYF